MTQKILIKFACRNNPEKFIAGINNILNFASQPQNIIILASIDTDDKTMWNRDFMPRIKPYVTNGHLRPVANKYENKVQFINRDIETITEPWQILVNYLPDTEFNVKGYDDVIRSKFIEHLPQYNGVLHFNDAQNQEKYTLPVIGRAYFETMGKAILPPFYSGYAAFDELAAVASLLNARKQLPDNIFVTKAWATDQSHAEAARDQQTFTFRKSQNFGVPPAAQVQPQLHLQMPATPPEGPPVVTPGGSFVTTPPVQNTPAPTVTLPAAAPQTNTPQGPKIICVMPWYNEFHPMRSLELQTCIQKTHAGGQVDELILACENCQPPAGFKGEILAERPTFNTMFAIANKYAQPGDTVIISNTDIYPAPGTRDHLQKLQSNECWALARWDENHPGQPPVHLNSRDTADTWIFKAPIANIDGNFYMGKAGCDNAINQRIQQAGYKISNPSKTVQFIHVHQSQVKSYNPADRVAGPYILITPHALGEQAVIENA